MTDCTSYNYKEYYERFKKLKEMIKNKEATWNDMEALRLEYVGRTEKNTGEGINHFAGNTLRQGCLLYDEFMKFGMIKDATKEEIFPRTKTVKEDGSTISEIVTNIDTTKLNSAEDLLKAHGFNPEEFDLISAKTSLWEQGTRSGKKNLYSSKISVKKKLLPENKEFYKEIFEEISKLNKNSEKNKNKDIENITKKDGNLLILSYNDLHWGRYTEDYYHEHDRIMKTLYSFKNRLKNNSYDEVVLVLGSDFFNSDAYGNTTEHKNKQSNWGDFKDIFASGVNLCIDMINYLAEWIQDVNVIFVAGNHGNNEDYFLGECIKAYYRNDYIVKVDSLNKPRKYFSYGNTLIGFTHGDKEKNNLGNIMAIESPYKWGLTTNRFWITGHFHSVKESIIESNGVTIYTCPSLALDDEWTKNMGYKSDKRIMGFVVDKAHGLIETHYVYPDI